MSDEWECFSDPAYYDMWCVRQVGSRTFGEGFHLVNGDEAKMLCRFLNTRPADRIEAQAAEIERLREALRPFAKAGEIAGEPSPYGDWYAYRPAAGDEYAIFGQHLRDARAALGETK